MRIFCDMDGVITDLVQSIVNAKGFTVGQLQSMMRTHGVENINAHNLHVVNADGPDFYDTTHHLGDEFWTEMHAMPHAGKIISLLRKFDPIFTIATMLSGSHYSASGKAIWLKRNMPTRGYILVGTKTIANPHPKNVLAAPDAVLIDDGAENCTAFRAAGGYAIHYCGYSHGVEVLAGIESRLEAIQSRLRHEVPVEQ